MIAAAAAIGLTLALRSGVLGGVAAIGRDLAVLDRAALSGAVGPRQLAALARIIDTVSHAPLAFTPPPPSAPTQQLASTDASPIPASVTPVQDAPATGRRGKVLPAASAPSTLITPRPAVPAAPGPAPRYQDFAPPPPTATPTPAQPAMQPAAPSTAIAHTLAMAIQFAGPLLAPTISAPAAPPAVATLTNPSSRTPAAPADPPPAAPRPVPAATASAATPPASDGTAPAASGDTRLVVDGYELGRWLDDRLDRAAASPPAAATGFDPRLSPAWPGPALG